MTLTEQREILRPQGHGWADLFSAEILDDGNLKIIATEQGKEAIRKAFAELGSNSFTFSNLSNQGTLYFDKRLLIQGLGLTPIDPVEIGALTSAPIVCLDGCKDYDEGKLSIEGPIWWHERYQVESICEVLAEKGEIILPKAKETKP